MRTGTDGARREGLLKRVAEVWRGLPRRPKGTSRPRSNHGGPPPRAFWAGVLAVAVACGQQSERGHDRTGNAEESATNKTALALEPSGGGIPSNDAAGAGPSAGEAGMSEGGEAGSAPAEPDPPDAPPFVCTEPEPPALEGFVVYATKSVWLGTSSSLLSGNIGVQQSSSDTPGAGELVLQPHVSALGGELFADTVVLKNDARAGIIWTNELIDQGGTAAETRALPSMPALPDPEMAEPGPTDVTVNARQVRTLVAGAYKNVVVGTKATLLLEAGVYDFARLDVGSEARVEALGPAILRISGRLDVGHAGYVGPRAATAGASDLTIDCGAVDPAPLPDSASVNFGESSSLHALLLAPNALVRLLPHSSLVGAIGAAHVWVGEGATLRREHGIVGPPLCTLAGCNDENPCTFDACCGGTCRNLSEPDGTACPDGDACNGAETCRAGACSPGSPPVVEDDGNPCTVDRCDPILGVVHTPAEDGTPCLDADVCNGTEVCAAGVCTPGEPLPPPLFLAPEPPDDGGVCSRLHCDPADGWLTINDPAGTTCDDETVCDGREICDGLGACPSAVPPVIDDGNPCTVDACDPISGVTNTNATNGTGCGDGDVCNGFETCQAGSCAPGLVPVLDDQNPCTADACHPVLGVTHTNLPHGTSCADANACDGEESCDGVGHCLEPVPPTGSPAGGVLTRTPWQKHEGEGVVFFPAGFSSSTFGDIEEYQFATIPPSNDAGWGPAPNGETIGFGRTSTLCGVAGCRSAADFTYFQSLVGVPAHVAVTQFTIAFSGIDDGVRTTIFNSSYPQGVVVPGSYAFLGGSSIANLAEFIRSGEINRVVVTHDDDCCSGSSLSFAQVVLNGVTIGSGTIAPWIDDGNPCTTDSCDPITGISHTPVLDGTSCSDNDVCDGLETCQAGTCSPGEPPPVPPSDACNDFRCDPVQGVISEPLPDGTPCLDANVCNGDETCQAGVCAPGTPPEPPSIPDANPFTALHATAVDVGSEASPQLGVVLDEQIGSSRSVVNFNGAAAVFLGPGEIDSRFAAAGVVFEGVTGSTQIGGTSNSGGISGEHMTVNPNFVASRVRIRFVDPVTGEPVLVSGMGAFTRSEDPSNCMEFFDGAGLSLGIACNQNPSFDPPTTVEFLGGRSTRGIAFVEVYAIGTNCPNCPYEIDLLAVDPTAPPPGHPEACQVPQCDPELGWRFTPAPAGTPCDDNTVCNGREVCNALGSCEAGTPPPVDDANVCTADSCDRVSGVIHTPVDDGMDCTPPGACGRSVCTGGFCAPSPESGQCMNALPQPVHWWPADGAFTDLTGSNPALSLGGVSFAPGKAGEAFDLNGSPNSVVEIEGGSALNFQTLTLEAWVKPRSFPNAFPTIFRKSTGPCGSGLYLLSLTDDGQAHCSINNLARVGDPVGGKVCLDTWSHVACTYDGAAIRLYVNGELVATGPRAGPIQGNSQPFGIGTELGGGSGCGSRRFDGLIDEPAIFDRALTPAEIEAIYAAGSAGKCKPPVVNQPPVVDAGPDQSVPFSDPVTLAGVVNDDGLPVGGSLQVAWVVASGPGQVTFADPASAATTATFSAAGTYLVRLDATDGELTAFDEVTVQVRPTPTCAPPPSGLIAWWPGDGNANDVRGASHGTMVNGATFAPGIVGQAFSLDGVDDGIGILKTSVLNLRTSDFSIGAWVKVSQARQGFVFLNYAGVPRYALHTTASGRAAVVFRPGVAITGEANDPEVNAVGTTNLIDGQWHHLVGVRRGLDRAEIYVDGALDGTATNPDVPSVLGGSVETGGCTYARIGAVHTGPGHCTSLAPNPQESGFTGLVDEVELFNRALEAAEIQAIYAARAAGKCKAGVSVPDVLGLSLEEGSSDIVDADLLVGDVEEVDGTIVLDNRYIPGRQGWTYNAPNGRPEEEIFHVEGGVLVQNSIGVGLPGADSNNYTLSNAIDPKRPYSVSVRARILEEEIVSSNAFVFGFYIGAEHGSEACTIGIGTGEIEIFGPPRQRVSVPTDDDAAHDYRIDCFPGVGRQIFVDDELVFSGSTEPAFRNQLAIGDGTGGRNAHVEVFSFAFTQPRIIEQSPFAGTLAPPQSFVDLVVASGPATVVVPLIEGLPQQDAEAAIVAAGLAVGTVETEFHPTLPAGSVTRQRLVHGIRVVPGTAVEPLISLGPAPTGPPPVLSNIRVTNIGPTSAIVRWTTDVPADSRVAYGPTSAYAALASTAGNVTEHAVTLANLDQNTLYHFQVTSQTATGGIAASGDHLFSTLAACELESVPPVDPVRVEVGPGRWEPAPDMIARHPTYATATALPSGDVLVVGGLVGSTPTATAELYSPGAGGWVAVPLMSSPRYLHTATLLGDGRVLVAGGHSGENLASAEIFDPITRTWAPAAAMPVGRNGHVAVALADGRVLVAGGEVSSGHLASAVVYSAVSNTWTTLPPMAAARAFASAARLPNGKVLLIAGRNSSGYMSSSELFDPETNTWSPAGSLATGRAFFAAALVGGKVLVTGGLSGNGETVLDSAELFDPATSSWSSAGRLPTRRAEHTAIVLRDGRALFLGGGPTSASTASRTVDAYDPSTGRWVGVAWPRTARRTPVVALLHNGEVLLAGGLGSPDRTAEIYRPGVTGWAPVASMNVPRHDFATVLLRDGRVLVAGGFQGPAVRTAPTATAEIYDPTSDTWTRLPDMSARRSRTRAALLPDGRVLVAGGVPVWDAPFTTLDSAEIFDPATATWQPAASMSAPRYVQTMTLLCEHDRVLAAGGWNGSPFATGLESVPTAELYAPGVNQWSSAPGMAFRHHHSATLLLDGRVLVAAGNRGSSGLAEIFDPDSGSWSAAGTLGDSRFKHRAVRFPDGRVLVAGGFNSGGASLRDVWIFDPATNGWTPTAPLDVDRVELVLQLLDSSSVLAAGGWDSGSSAIYDIASGIWSPAPAMNGVRGESGTVRLLDGRVFIAGAWIRRALPRRAQRSISELWIRLPSSPPLATTVTRFARERP